MKCPSCQNGSLNPHFIDQLFRSHKCNQCEGDWILVEDFVSWKDRNPEYRFNESLNVSEEISDTKQAMLCPVSGVIMRKFKISAEHDHRIDYSHLSGGIWLDKGEWELLKAENIAGSLNKVVTQVWQNQIREDSAIENFKEIYANKFSNEDYTQLKEVKAWLDQHPQKHDLRAYLMAEDPYSAQK